MVDIQNYNNQSIFNISFHLGCLTNLEKTFQNTNVDFSFKKYDFPRNLSDIICSHYVVLHLQIQATGTTPDNFLANTKTMLYL